MKKYLLLFCLFIFALTSCKKSATTAPFDAAAQAATDEAAIQTYLKANPSITATKDASGLYYQILDPGTGDHPTATSNVSVGYTTSELDSTVLKTISSSYLSLGSHIQAWKVGLPLIGKGGTILMIVPSALGYGNENYDNIPANTVIIYKVTLQGFNNAAGI